MDINLVKKGCSTCSCKWVKVCADLFNSLSSQSGNKNNVLNHFGKQVEQNPHKLLETENKDFFLTTLNKIFFLQCFFKVYICLMKTLCQGKLLIKVKVYNSLKHYVFSKSLIDSWH